jgi:hypothetical protein
MRSCNFQTQEIDLGVLVRKTESRWFLFGIINLFNVVATDINFPESNHLNPPLSKSGTKIMRRIQATAYSIRSWVFRRDYYIPFSCIISRNASAGAFAIIYSVVAVIICVTWLALI